MLDWVVIIIHGKRKVGSARRATSWACPTLVFTPELKRPEINTAECDYIRHTALLGSSSYDKFEHWVDFWRILIFVTFLASQNSVHRRSICHLHELIVPWSDLKVLANINWYSCWKLKKYNAIFVLGVSNLKITFNIRMSLEE